MTQEERLQRLLLPMHLYHRCDLRGTIAEAVVADALSSQLEYMCTRLRIGENIVKTSRIKHLKRSM